MLFNFLSKSFSSLENFFGTIALITSIIGLIPQIYKSYKSKSSFDVSMAMLVNWLVCSLSWVIHGFYTNSQFVVYSNVTGAIFSIIAIIQKVIYDRNTEKSF